MTTDSRLLPSLSCRWGRSMSVTVFMAVNCMELMTPRQVNSRTMAVTGVCAPIKAKLMANNPNNNVLTSRKRR